MKILTNRCKYNLILLNPTIKNAFLKALKRSLFQV